MKRKILVIVVLSVVIVVLSLFLFRKSEPVDFSADVKPILNKHCITCHGGVKKNGGFSLLFEEEAFAKTESGKPAIVRGAADHSEFIRRLTSEDPELRMPYNAPMLTDSEIDILKRWVNEGAKWGEHWAYTLPTDVQVPKPFSFSRFFGLTEGDLRSDIDYFVQDKLTEKGLSFSAEADKETLLRRVYLDLLGVPPTLADVRSFLNDDRDDAYERRVDSLLLQPQYGEKWASWWLDMARYADTKGYEKDGSRQIWAYRDWVIKAFNNDMPFDQFTIEQLAGDLLPDPTKDQLIATAFHRNTMNNDEGGTDSEEFRVAAVLDRVNTTYQVWLSTTFECVQCHSHTYDPFKFEEYYQSVAFFNNTRDEDTQGDHPKLRFYTAQDELRIDSIKQWLASRGGAGLVKSADLFLHTLEPKIHAHYSDRLVNGALYDTKWLGVRDGGSARLRAVNLSDKKQFYMNFWTGSSGGELEIRKDKIDGELLAAIAIPATSGRQVMVSTLAEQSGVHDLYLVFNNSSIPADQPVCMIEWFAFREGFAIPSEDPIKEKIQNEFLQLVNSQPQTVPIMIENPKEMHRKTFVFERGNRLTPGVEVQPMVPESLNDFPENAQKNRLGFAQWIVSKDNPLTARTLVNRVWAQLFGRGLVEPLGDMGTQSTPPIHRELLDYLSLKMMDENWSIKSLIREIVVSSTYRQSSSLNNQDAGKDPENFYLARGPRFRLSAEQIRDQALTVSGLLSKKMYGPSVMPYQPDGVWMTVYSGESWATSAGEDQYRRGVYTFLKRTSPYPSFISFDASSREVCLVDRIRTNTPLQALTTLNDPVYLEAAKNLAGMMEKDGKGDVESCIKVGYRRIMLKEPIPEKTVALQKLYVEAFDNFSKKPAEAAKFMGVDPRTFKGEELASKAAFMVVANALLNLDEFLTKS